MKNYTSLMRNQRGNVFFAIFGAVALVGVLTAGVATFVKGPLATSVKITRQNTAENQMSIAGQVAVMAAANAPGGGDCDGDSFVEPIEWREDLTKPFPVGGGLIPMSIGISKKDPWGTEYGYCVWDHGALHNGAGSCGGSTQKRLEGTDSKIYPVVALVSAGPDKTFTTTCRDFVDADVNGDGDLEDDGVDLPLVGKANSSDDDVIFTYTYEEATGASGGLWSLKSGDPDTAVIDKKIESTGVGSFQGGVLLPDSSLITCDPTTAGIMARSASGDGIQICDGASWQEISGGVSTPYGVGLVIDPNTSSGMNITAPCGTATCYSSNVTFAVVNKLQPPVASDVLTVTLTNTTNFQKVSDNCNGQSIPAGGNCQITVRARAMGNIAYTGVLRITGNNSPFANMDGVSSGFSCNPGGDAPGGKYVGCNIGGYNLITTPSGCTGGTSNPTCAGGNDTVSYSNSTSNAGSVLNGCCGSTGQQNTANMLAYSGGGFAFPAASYCDSLEYGGYSDWFLPSSNEFSSHFYPNRAVLGLTNGAVYWTSSSQNLNGANWWYYVILSSNSVNANEGNTSYLARCMRWDPARTVTPMTDSTPASVFFTPSSGNVAAEARTSNTVTITGITGNVNVAISGGSGAQFSKNGAAYSNAATTVTNGDTLTLRANSPVAGQEDIVSLTVGTAGFSWQIRTVANNTVYAFVTSTTYPNFSGGLAGADAQCNARAAAAGLGGSWIALLATGVASNEGPASRAPWNWTTLKNLNNQVVATSYADFTDGSLSAPLNRNEFNAVASATWAWTGAGNTTGVSGTNGSFYYQVCNGWTSGGAAGTYGAVHSTNLHFYGADGNYTTCANAFAFYCLQDPGASLIDTDPAEVIIRPGIAYAPNAAALSNAVSVTSILQPVTVTITPTNGGTANIIKNGVSQGATSTMANPNDSIQFSLTVPAVLGTKSTANIQIGDDPYTWWAGYADSAKETRAFVTSQQYGANLGGLVGADAKCAASAAGSPYGLGSKWKAILSSSTQGAAQRVSWNWGTLKSVTGTTIVDGGYNDLFDGTWDAALSTTEQGTTFTGYAWTGSNGFGVPYHSNGVAATNFCNDWQGPADGYSVGSTTSPATALFYTSHGSWGCTYVPYSLYCLEDTDDSTDSIPNDMNIPYKIQIAASSRQSSDPVVIGGMSAGVTQTLSVSATGGTPTFTVNGGAEVTSATVRNGDSIVFMMTAPATDNSNYRMTITASSMTSYWRVWTGDSTGTAIKRIFVSNATYHGNLGGATGAHATCKTMANAAGLPGNWKAVISGHTENEWAINNVGYGWTRLQLLDGTNVVYAGNLWLTETQALLAPITMTQTMLTAITDAHTNTKPDGTAFYRSGNEACNNYQSNSPSPQTNMIGRSSANGVQWLNGGSMGGYGCSDGHGLYCIEQ